MVEPGPSAVIETILNVIERVFFLKSRDYSLVIITVKS